MQSLHRARRQAAGCLAALFAVAGCSLPALASPSPHPSGTAPPVSITAAATPTAPVMQVVKLLSQRMVGFPPSGFPELRGLDATKTVNFYWDGESHPYLNLNPDGTGGMYFYDTLKVFVADHLAETVSSPCADINEHAATGIQALALIDDLKPGYNSIKVELWNTCGYGGNMDLFITAPGAVYTPDSPAASPPSVADPVVPPPTAPAAPPADPPFAPTINPPAAVMPPSQVISPPAAAPAEPPTLAPAPALTLPPTDPTPAVTPPPPAPPQSPRKSASASLAACGSAKFFGVRGSGEKRSDFQGYGQTVGMMEGFLQVNTPSMKSEAVNYRAIPVSPQNFSYSSDYVNSVEGGAQTLMRDLRHFIRSCPTTYAMLAGYSQGAEVVGLVYGRLSDTERRHISSVTLFGDPRFNPGQLLVNQGDFSARYQGIDVAVLGDLKGTVPAGWEARVHSYCTLGDPICNFNLRNLPACNLITGFITCAHGMYYDRGFTDDAAVWARHMLAIMPPL